MSDPLFFPQPSPLTLADASVIAEAELRGDGSRLICGLAPLSAAGPADISFLDNPAYLEEFVHTRAGACVVAPKYMERAPDGIALLVSRDPYRAFARIAAALFPLAMQPRSSFGDTGVSPTAIVHGEARLEPGVVVDPGAVIGPRAEVGAGTVVGANAVIGPDVRIGRQCSIGAGATVVHTLVGNRVIIHQGARIGQDGFGFAMGPKGHLKVPQIGRVIIQDDVEIGAGTAIDRGANRDTVIGEGTKIDNLVQIGHNVMVGRHCVIVAQTGISGSVTLEDFVTIGGQAGIIGHVNIGMGAQIAAASRVINSIPAGQRWGGTPAKPIRAWLREVAMVTQLAAREQAERLNADPD